MRLPFRSSSRSSSAILLSFRPGPAFVLLAVLLGIVWILGGASREDALAQVAVRGVVWVLLAAAALFGERPSLRPVRPVLLLLAAALLLALAQLVPLPPGIWQALPGRAMLAEAATASGQPQPWRPWSIVPGATLNAASSLVVPFAALLFAAGLKEDERSWLPGLLLALVAASVGLGLLQFSAGGIDNPFINDTVGEVNGTFANRNHFALFVAWGCILAPAWAFAGGRRPGWRAPVAFGLGLLFVLLLLAIGSRAGLLLGLLAIGAGPLLARRAIRRELRQYPRWVLSVLLVAAVAIVAIVVLASIVADRAVSIDRVFTAGQDMRSRALPTVLAMIRDYFPWGSGLGGFAPLFRMHEPSALLQYTYHNHAHNDVLEVALDAGLPGLALLAVAIGWWAWASIRAWRASDMLARAGSTMLLLLLIASLVDYPARTPLVMAVAVLAATWLARAKVGPALPSEGPHL